MTINIIIKTIAPRAAAIAMGAAVAVVVGGSVGCVDGAGDVGDIGDGDDDVPPGVFEDPSDNPLRDLPDDLQRQFDNGDAAFEARHFPAQGLGPLYIRSACAACHADDGKGPGFVEKIAIVDDDGVAIDGALPFGATLRPFFTAPATRAFGVVDAVAGVGGGGDGDVVVSTRTGPPVFGRGFIEAIADAEIERVELAQQSGRDGVSGRIHRVSYNSEANPDSPFHNHQKGDSGLIGRFGDKARVATLDEFTADAYQGDMGLTSPLRPTEPPNPEGVTDDARAGVDVDLDTVNAAADYVRLLAIPKRAPFSDDASDVAAAVALFDAVGCNACHVPSLRTDAGYPIAALADIDAPVFTDLLLHDMGDDLQDHIVDGDPVTGASGREWKTAPLIGLRFFRGFLHDSRASTVAEAIDGHASPGSEANAAVDRFHQLTDEQRALLVGYVESL